MQYEEKWRRERERRAFLALEDGTVFRGVAFGAARDAAGEVVFNTGMAGYQEVLTDPSYAGQFVAMTYPEIGNYGTNAEDAESRGLWLNGFIVANLDEPSNFRSTGSLDECLKRAGKPGLYGVDTRSLTEHIRDFGNKKAYLCADGSLSPDEAVAKAQEWKGLDGQDYAARVTCGNDYEFSPRPTSLVPRPAPVCDSATNTVPAEKLVVVYDFGVKLNILRSLAAQGFRVKVVPATTPAEEVLAMKPDGVFLSNGPGDPSAIPYAIDNIRKILGRVPVMGICLGHQLLSIACGAQTGRLKFGHHGCNHPVKNLLSGKIEITSQNHNFAVLADSIPSSLEVTHLNLNDGSIEGVRHKTFKAFSVQYHPEASPGPRDSAYLFNQFREML